MTFLVNPTILSQIRDTPDFERRRRLSFIADRFRFTEFNVTIFLFFSLLDSYPRNKKMKFRVFAHSTLA